MVMQRPAKPFTPVRFRLQPPSRKPELKKLYNKLNNSLVDYRELKRLNISIDKEE